MNHIAPPSTEPCVWMAAGLVNYKLCDRDFDCTHCPLDLALHGGRSESVEGRVLSGCVRRDEGFPNDRRYAPGHTWVTSRPGEPTVRIGLDGFAAALIPRPISAKCTDAPRVLRRGDVMCAIELPEGTLSIRVPVGGQLERHNPALRDQPGLLVEFPYRDGWLVDLIPSADELPTLEGLQDATAARERTALHLRRFRRHVALHLLTDVSPVGPCMADGGQALTNLSDILGGAGYLKVLREVLR